MDSASPTYFHQFLCLVSYYRLGDIASLLGLLITILGFALALWRIWKLQDASDAVRDQLLVMNAFQGLSAAIKTLEDIRRLHRLKAWSVLPDRYTLLRKELITIIGRTPSLADEQRTSIQVAIQQLLIMERQVERTIAGAAEPEVNRMNDVISKQLDRLAVLVVELQNEIDRSRQ